MANIRFLILLLVLCLLIAFCNGQANKKPFLPQPGSSSQVGGPFENSDFTYRGMPKNISHTDTSPGWKQQGQKILLTGTVYRSDGKTPAAGVLLYYYQTNTAGKYVHQPEEPRSMPPNAKGQTHGYIRGWVKTGADGKYFVYTVRPGSYSGFDDPAHVHVTIKEPNDLNEYYIDDFVFDDDKRLTSAKRKALENRGGNGTLRLVQKGDLHIGERDIILGLNIPAYPGRKPDALPSGNSIGTDVFSFLPYHAWGQDKGTRTCPVCKYGWYHGILYFVGNNPEWDEIKSWLLFLEKESRLRQKYLKAYFVYGNAQQYSQTERTAQLEQIGRQLQLEHVALTFVPSFSDTDSEIHLNAIHQTVDNTFILYRRSRIVDKFVDLKPTSENFNKISMRLDETTNEYFHLPQPAAFH